MPKTETRAGGHLVTKHIRIHRQYVERLEAIAGALEASEEFAPGGRLLKQDQLQLALRIGIETLEKSVDKGEAGG